MKTKRTKASLLLTIFCGIVFLDRITKWFVVRYLPQNGFNIFSGFRLQLSYNRGVSWGLFGEATSLSICFIKTLIILFLVAFAVYTVLEWRAGKNVFAHIFVLAGGISNIIDRFLYGAVVDFIVWYVGSWQWPTFNIADACVVCGVLVILGNTFLKRG